MSHRKFEAPRHGSLGFLPRKRTRKHRGKVRSWPRERKGDNQPSLQAFPTKKAGMTHVLRNIDRPGSNLHKRDVVEAVTILEAAPIRVVGVIGYVATPSGLRAVTTAWAQNLSDQVRRRFYKNWYRSSKKRAFTKYAGSFTDGTSEVLAERLQRIKDNATVVRVLAHTQTQLYGLREKKAHLLEIQVNGGDVAAKVDWAVTLFEQEVTVDSVFQENEFVDAISVTKGHGFEGVVTRWGVKRLARKTHRGLRKVACIGSWHPARVSFTVARAGQRGYHHRTEQNKLIYRIGKPNQGEEDLTGATETDLTKKGINPLGGFPHYGIVRNDFIMIKGCVAGAKARSVILRKSIVPCSKRSEPVSLLFISTASKMGHGRFQTKMEKAAYYS